MGSDMELFIVIAVTVMAVQISIRLGKKIADFIWDYFYMENRDW